MIYQPRVNRIIRKKKEAYIALGSFILLMAVLLVATGFGNGVSSTLSYVLAPLLRGKILLVQALENIPVKSRGELTKENQMLSVQVLAANARLSDLSFLQSENQRLKDMLGRTEGKKLILGAVLAKPNQSPYDTLLIDIGSNKGISVNMTVFAYGNVPIGKVAEVYANSSLVRLFSSPGEENSVLIGANSIQAIAKGEGGGNFVIVLPKDTKVSEGDAIKIPGIDPNIIGKVEKIESSDTETFAQVLFKNSVNLYDLSSVFVEISKN